jgi:splicing factor U2AF 65 kDa subunit
MKVQLPTSVLVLKNMVEVSELENDEDYVDLLEDIKEECSKYGTLLNIQIPRASSEPGVKNPGVGLVFLQYSTIDEAKEARKV